MQTPGADPRCRRNRIVNDATILLRHPVTYAARGGELGCRARTPDVRIQTVWTKTEETELTTSATKPDLAAARHAHFGP